MFHTAPVDTLNHLGRLGRHEQRALVRRGLAQYETTEEAMAAALPPSALAPTGPDVVPWTTPSTPRPTPISVPWLNQGCPAGYVSQIVAPRTLGAVDYGNPAGWVQCRKVQTLTAARVVAENQAPWWARAVLKTPALPALPPVPFPSLPQLTWTPLLIAGGAIVGLAALSLGLRR